MCPELSVLNIGCFPISLIPVFCLQSETATNSVPVEEKVGGEESPAAVVAATTTAATSDEGAPKFKSALLQQMLGNKGRLGRSTEKLSDSSKSSSEEKEDDIQKKAEEVTPVPVVTEEQELKEQEEQKEQQPELELEQKAETEQVEQPETWQEQQQDVEQPQQQEPALEQQSELIGQGEEVRRDEEENSEEKPVIQMNDIVIEDAGEQGEAVDDPATEAAPVQSTKSLQQGDSIAEGKDSCSELGNGDLVGNTDVVVSGNGEMPVNVMTSSNAECLSDEDSKESLRERLEQDKDIDTAEADSGVRSGEVVSEDVQRTETTVSSAVCADPPDLLGGLGSAAVSGGHRDLNGFSRCDENSDDMLQLDSK